MLTYTRSNIELKLQTFSEQSEAGGNCSLIEELRLYVHKEKSIYTNMNVLNINNQTYIGYCWIPTEKSEQVMGSIKRLKEYKQNIIGAEFTKVRDIPRAYGGAPTYFPTNEFTNPFQVKLIKMNLFDFYLNFSMFRKLLILMEFLDIEKLTLD